MMDPLPLGYRKVILPSLQDDKNIEALQSYNPIYSLFFDMHEANYNKVCFEHSKYIADLNHIVKSENPTKKVKFPMYIKYAPLIDPIHYLIGKYSKENKKWLQLPQLHSTVDTCMKKVLDYNNTCYVDTFFNYLSSRTLKDYHFYHGIDFFGSPPSPGRGNRAPLGSLRPAFPASSNRGIKALEPGNPHPPPRCPLREAKMGQPHSEREAPGARDPESGP